ncbi:TPA: hypothetical protein I4G69_004450 [Enterobacter asburiae]|nr:hypothetical protein [Enterobacter asburiae]
MSVPNQTPYIIYNANGLTTVFPFEFYVINAGDIQVTVNGTVVTSGYSVSGVGNAGGGDVVFVTPPASGAAVMLERVVPTYRLTDYQDNGDLLADTVNKDFDRLWMAIQRSFIYLGLALRRPLLGGPYDAQGYRIEKGADPVNLQDFATKNYVDNVSLVRALRVPESQVSVLPPASQRANQLLAFNASGQPITVLPPSGSASDVLIELAKPTGAGLIGILPQGDLQDAIPEFYVDQFGANPTGATSSTAAVNAALAAINSVVDSPLNKDPSIPYAKLVFGKGVYKLKDVLIKSGVCYEGQDGYATRIEPEDGSTSGFCFVTYGTEAYTTGREGKRMFRALFKNLVIGYDLQRIYATPIPANNIGGIQIKYASYVNMENILFNSLDGIALSLGEVWDAYFKEIRMLWCGNTRNSASIKYSLQIYGAEAVDTGSDTLRFDFLHIENTPAGFYIGPRSTNITFNYPKFEMGKGGGDVSCIIAGVDGLTMNNPQLSWSIPSIPMIDMLATNSSADTNQNNNGNLNSNNNRRVILNNPLFGNSQNNIGWFIRNGSDRDSLVIDGGSSINVRYTATGKNVRFKGHKWVTCYGTFYSEGDFIVEDCEVVKHRAPYTGSPGGSNPISIMTFTGPNNRLQNTRFWVPYGLSTDSNVCVTTNSSSELFAIDNEFVGTWGTGFQFGSDANARRARGNRLLNGANFGSLFGTFPEYGSLPSKRLSSTGGTSSAIATIAVDASAPISSFIGGATMFVVRAKNASGTYIGAGVFLTDPQATVIEIGDIGGRFSVNGGGVSGDGQIWIQQSAGNISIVNRTTTSISLSLVSIMAEF